MTMGTFMLQQADQIKNSLAAGIAQSIVYGKNLGEILSGIGKQVAAAFIEMMVKQQLAAVLGKTLQAAAVGSTIAAATAIGSAWSGPAYLASVATMGSAAAIGGASLATGLLGSMALSGAMMAGGGALGGAPVGLPSAMPMAYGGIVTGPTYALIGEGRYDEAVIPLDKDTLAGLGLGGANGVTIQQNNYGDIHRDVDYERIQANLGGAVAAALRG